MAVRGAYAIGVFCTTFFIGFTGYVWYTERSDRQKLKDGAARDINEYQRKLAIRLKKDQENKGM